MKVYYLYNENERARLNENGLDYTPAYIGALCAFMGVTASPIAPDELDKLCEDDVLIVGSERVDALPKCKCVLLGTSIGKDANASERIEKVFAEYELADGKKIPLFVPVKAQEIEGDVLAYAYQDGEKLPALVKNGNVYEFCFDMAASVWFSGDGYEPTEPSNYFPIGRTPDFRPLKSQLECDAFNDLVIGELENTLLTLGVPMLYKLPAKDGKVPDMLIHFSGDDDCSSKDINLEAARNMNKMGFPYHINAMAAHGEGFVFDRDIYDELNSLGCEIALHMDFTENVPHTFEALKHQADLFREHFGKEPYTNVNHCLVQGNSTAERMRWFEDCGIFADNGKLGYFDPADINAFDLRSFGFGSSFPRFTLDDAQHQNKPIAVLEIPITYYEPRLYTEDQDTSKITSYIDEAKENGRIIQFFIHPHYLSFYYEEKIEATLRVLRVIKEHTKHYNALFTTTNNITRFWLDRADSKIDVENGTIKVNAKSPCIVTLPSSLADKTVLVDGKETVATTREQRGTTLTLVCVDKGEHTVTFN